MIKRQVTINLPIGGTVYDCIAAINEAICANASDPLNANALATLLSHIVVIEPMHRFADPGDSK